MRPARINKDLPVKLRQKKKSEWWLESKMGNIGEIHKHCPGMQG